MPCIVDDLGLLFDLQALFWLKIIVYRVHMNLQAVFVRVVSSFAWIIEYMYIALANVWVSQTNIKLHLIISYTYK